MLVKTDVLHMRGEKSVIAYPPKLVETLDNLTANDKEVLEHYIGGLPDEAISLKEEDDAGKPYFTMPQVGTEDMLFCYRAKKKGAEIWADTDIDTGHVGFAPVITREFRRQAKGLGNGTTEQSHSGVQVLRLQEGSDDADGQAVSVSGMRKPALDTRRVTSLT